MTNQFTARHVPNAHSVMQTVTPRVRTRTLRQRPLDITPTIRILIGAATSLPRGGAWRDCQDAKQTRWSELATHVGHSLHFDWLFSPTAQQSAGGESLGRVSLVLQNEGSCDG